MFSWLKRLLGWQSGGSSASDGLGQDVLQEAQGDEDEGLAATRGTVAFSDGERTWQESFDLVQITRRALHQQGYEMTALGDALEHVSGMKIWPLIRGMEPVHKQGVKTLTTVEVEHPKFGGRVFEYQHSAGKDMEESLYKGIENWVMLDFVTLLDALGEKPEKCTYMDMSFPARGGKPARNRRVVLGPVSYMTTTQEIEKPTAGEDGEHPPFCQCCLFTHTMEVFKPLLEGTGFHAIRFFAMRDADGGAQADCRVNGEDSEAGMSALREYVQTWPDRGVEFRKQYVLVMDGATSGPVAT